MYPIEYQIPLPEEVLADHKDRQRRMQRQGLRESHLVKRLHHKPILSNLVLPLADLMIVSGKQLKERYQLI